MMDSKFKDEKNNPILNDVDWVNFFYPFTKIFDGEHGATIISEKEVSFMDVSNLNSKNHNTPTFSLQQHGIVHVLKNNPFDIANGSIISKFMLLAAVKFKNDSFATMSFIRYHVRKSEVPYIRVGVDYYKVISKENRYGSMDRELKQWSKEEIKEDHGKSLMKLIYKYDDFTIVPNNTSYTPSYLNCYNLYSKFPHTPHSAEVEKEEIPHTIGLIEHIFGSQYDIGMKYIKILYENPKQILPVLVLVSTERETGKTTFLNWIHMIFGENAVLISPQELTSNFNSGYATKNIIMVDETVIEKSTSVERLKSLATAKYISVSEKHVSQYSIPFFGKIIICTNKEKDFMRIDEEEIRFWIRKIKVITNTKNTNIENDLFAEIPKFIKYLTQMSVVDLSKSRMVFTMDEIKTNELQDVKEESKSWLRKEIEILLDNFFTNYNFEECYATATDIKEIWFKFNHQVTISYIRKVLKYEIGLKARGVEKYYPFGGKIKDHDYQRTGRPFLFINNLPVEDRKEAEQPQTDTASGNGGDKNWVLYKEDDEFAF